MYQPRHIVDVTLSADTSIFANGDVIADTQIVSNACFDKARAANLDSLVLIDEDDQGAALDLYFFDANVSMGTENGAPNVTDASMRSLLGIVPVATSDYKDVGGSKVANLRNLGLMLKPATDALDVYVAAVNGAGTPTYTASGLKLRLGIES